METENQKTLEETLRTPKQIADSGFMSLVVQWRERKKGRLKFYQSGRKILYSPEHIQEYLKSCEKNAQN
jgi:hypothetical protein